MAKKYCMYKAVILQEQGKKQWEIARELGVTDRTVRNYLKKHGQKVILRPDVKTHFLDESVDALPS